VDYGTLTPMIVQAIKGQQDFEYATINNCSAE